MIVFVSPVFAQSTSLDFPTPVSTDRIAGRIRARDIGDSRLTSHYYIFETGTGDVLLNIETANLNGDIDVYTAGSLKPLLKASVYAVGYATVMQRELYVRLPSRLILRVEGRSPNDDPASYKIQFGGEFKSIAASSMPRNPGDPKVSDTETEDARARVSSVGTIIEEIKPPPPVEEPKKPEKEGTPKEKSKTTTAKNTPKGKPKNPPASNAKPKSPAPEKTAKTEKTEKKDDPAAKGAKDTGSSGKTKAKTPDKPKTDADSGTSATSGANKKPPVKPQAKLPSKTTGTKPKTGAPAKPPKDAPDPLEGVSLVVELKDGTTLKFAMTDVQRVNVDKGLVTIVLKNGDIERLSLLDIVEIKIGR